MRWRSKKLEAAHAIYRAEVPLFLAAHPWCERCRRHRSQEVHHKAGREGWLLLAKEYWMAVCHDCHRWITNNGKSAARMGWKFEVTREQHETRSKNSR